MTTPSFPESGENLPISGQQPDFYMETIQDIQQQQAELKTDIERISQNVERFRIFFQTLVSGLVIAVLLAFGIAIWYAYRSFSQQQIARQMAEETAATQEEISSRVGQLEETLQRLEQDFPDQLGEMSDEVQANQAELRQLRDRLEAVSTRIETIDSADNNSSDNNSEDSQTANDSESD